MLFYFADIIDLPILRHPLTLEVLATFSGKNRRSRKKRTEKGVCTRRPRTKKSTRRTAIGKKTNIKAVAGTGIEVRFKCKIP